MIYGNIDAKEVNTSYVSVIHKKLNILRNMDIKEMHHGTTRHR